MFVLQPGLVQTRINAKELVANDCFHPSAAGHGVLARALWNNMVQPPASKASAVEGGLWCPSPDTTLA